MEAVQSNKGLTTTERALIALPAALFLSVYLLGNFALRGQIRTPEACHLDVRSEYVIPLG
jgi:hypothetical protein